MPSIPSQQSFFNGALDFTIGGGNFYHVAGDLRHTSENEDRVGRGIDLLHQNMATDALYDAEQRFPPPNCHPGTRIHILETIRTWIWDGTKSTSIFWLHGPAGVGKSAIAQTISEEFVSHHSEPSNPFSGKLAASFFFARTDPHRNNLSRFFITIAYQLATSGMLSPVLYHAIDKAVRMKHNLLHTKLEDQFQKLIFEPCAAVTPFHPWRDLPKLVVIDGLDECIDIPSQERLLCIISKAKSFPSFPLEFLICSRPEPRIKDAFSLTSFQSILECYNIGESEESREDIAMYLREGFDKIHNDHRRAMSHIPSPWPSEEINQQLVRRACGQFIYAATVLKYVGDYRCFPPENLEIILKITVPEDFDSPYPDLDLLYNQILSTCTLPQKDLGLLLDVLAHLINPGAVISHDIGHERATPFYIEGIFFLKTGKIWTLLFGLHSVLHIPESNEEEIKILHASFIDFLTDPKRSGRFFVDRRDEATHERLTRNLLKRIFYAIQHQEEAARMTSEFDKYAWAHWPRHCRRAIPSEELLSTLNKLDIYGFVNTAMQRTCTCLGDCVAALRESLSILESIASWAESHGETEVAKKFWVLKNGFQAQLAPSDLDEERLTQVIEVLKYGLVVYEPGNWMLISSLLRVNYPFDVAGFDAAGVSQSYLPHPPVIVVGPLPSQMDRSNASSSADTLSIEFVKCHYRMCTECLRVLMDPSDSLPAELTFYAQSQWINHLLATGPPFFDTLELLRMNIHRLQTRSVTREAIVWASQANFPDIIVELRDEVVELLEEKIGELIDQEQKSRAGPIGLYMPYTTEDLKLWARYRGLNV